MTFRERILFNLWNRHKKTFLSFYVKEVAKPILKTDLRYIFTDLQGKKYYEFSQDKPLPLERFGEQTRILEQISKGFSLSEQTVIFDEMKKSLANGLKDTRMISRIAFLIGVMEDRATIGMHTELLYELVAVQWVREDEMPETFNSKIQSEKVSAFKEYVAAHGSYFFFQSAPLKKLNHLLNMSESEWTTLFHESLIKQQALKELLLRFQSQRSNSEPLSPVGQESQSKNVTSEST
jgi:hypothetical protein